MPETKVTIERVPGEPMTLCTFTRFSDGAMDHYQFDPTQNEFAVAPDVAIGATACGRCTKSPASHKEGKCADGQCPLYYFTEAPDSGVKLKTVQNEGGK